MKTPRSGYVKKLRKLRELSLFSGYGGMTLGLRLTGWPVETVAYVESDPWCQRVLRARMDDGSLDVGDIHGDIREFGAEQYAGRIDLVTGGFPCQPHSHAGSRKVAKGESDPRNLWPETREVIRVVGPRWVVLENVPGILSGNDGRQGFGISVLGELSELGFDGKWGVYSAADAGAPHLRKRWWVLAHAKSRKDH